MPARTGPGGGRFGRWSDDERGRPRFELAPLPALDGDRSLVLPEGGTERLWHQVGSPAITATAHAGGWTEVYATARGVLRLTDRSCWWGVPGRAGPRRSPLTVRWGVDHAEWETIGQGVAIRRRVRAPTGTGPHLEVEVDIEVDAPVRYREAWPIRPLLLLPAPLMSRPVRPPDTESWGERVAWWLQLLLSGAARAVAVGARRAVSTTLRGRAATLPPPDSGWAWRGGPRPAPATTPAWVDRTLPIVSMRLLDGPGDADVAPSEGVVDVRVPQGSTHLRFAFAVVDPCVGVPEGPEPVAPARGRGLDLHSRVDPALAREVAWHGAMLTGCQQHDALFRQRYPAQGSAYGFLHAVQGAPRDYALASVPLTLVDPEGARQSLQVICRMTSPDGAVHYAHAGRGRCTGGGIHRAPTDLPLFLLWAVTEYVWATGDGHLLDERVPFWPPPHAGASTVRERLLLAFHRVRDRIGTGPHGLLRVGSGDWNDPLAAFVPDRGTFHRRGESTFTSALAAHCLPRAAALVADAHPGEAAAMRDLAADLARAVGDAFTGRWYLRGWDGRGGPIGADHLFLDGQVWALIAGCGTDAQRAIAVASIATRCLDPSPVGATILDRPHPTRHGLLPAGWDTNGGVWAAINGLLAWALALHDPALAWRALQRQTLAAHADAYPHVWYGIWSGPDATNAWFGDRPGQTYVQPATPMVDFPVMNSNVHAGVLLALLRVLGVEATPDGLAVVRTAPPGTGTLWHLDTALGRLSGRVPTG